MTRKLALELGRSCMAVRIKIFVDSKGTSRFPRMNKAEASMRPARESQSNICHSAAYSLYLPTSTGCPPVRLPSGFSLPQPVP
jgi:hypothetical protein